jgi:pimeloyl-ACP methyl ester carboxylesterase
MFYNARWYDPALGRFAQADSIVPGGVQGYDRYAYVNNSPLNHTDPSGYCTDATEYFCRHSPDFYGNNLPSTQGTIGLFGGSQGNSMVYPGPKIPGAQLAHWTKPVIGYTTWPSRYPGYFDFTLSTRSADAEFWNWGGNSIAENPNAGKPGQAKWANLYGNPDSALPVVVVGYSSGADAGVLYAKIRRGENLPVEALVLIGPAFQSIGLSGEQLGEADYKSMINDFGRPTLIVDVQSQIDHWRVVFNGNSNEEFQVYTPQQGDPDPHWSMSNDLSTTEKIYQWIENLH